MLKKITGSFLLIDELKSPLESGLFNGLCMGFFALQVAGVVGEGLVVVVKVLELVGQCKQLHDWECEAFEVKHKFPA